MKPPTHRYRPRHRASPAAQALADFRDELEVTVRFARLVVARLRQIDIYQIGDAAGARTHDHDARREEDRLRNRVRDEDNGRARGGPDAQHLRIQALARHLVKGTEGLVHQQQRRFERQRPRDGDALLHSARQLMRIVMHEAAQLDKIEHLLDARVAG